MGWGGGGGSRTKFRYEKKIYAIRLIFCSYYFILLVYLFPVIQGNYSRNLQCKLIVTRQLVKSLHMLFLFLLFYILVVSPQTNVYMQTNKQTNKPINE